MTDDGHYFSETLPYSKVGNRKLKSLVKRGAIRRVVCDGNKKLITLVYNTGKGKQK
jgi:hypothetical protein